jgi:transposase-like protein
MVVTPVESDVSRQQDPDPEVPERARVRHYSPAYKLRVLQEYETLDKAGKGALLRREGLYSSLITEWRRQRDRGAAAGLAKWSTAVIRDGSCGQFLKAMLKVGTGEAPAERLGVAAAVSFEGEDPLCQDAVRQVLSLNI